MDCNPPGSSVHGIFQAGVLEWGAITFPWTARRSNQSILKEISPEYSLEELMYSNCDAREDSESPLDFKEIQPVYPKGNQS